MSWVGFSSNNGKISYTDLEGTQAVSKLELLLKLGATIDLKTHPTVIILNQDTWETEEIDLLT